MILNHTILPGRYSFDSVWYEYNGAWTVRKAKLKHYVESLKLLSRYDESKAKER